MLKTIIYRGDFVFSVIYRTSIMYIIIIFAVRIMGKKSLGEFQPIDLVATVIISNLTSLVIEAPELPIITSIVPILLIMSYEVFVSLWVKRSDKLAHIIQGKSIILIQNGIINQNAMKELRFSIDDVLEAMRTKDVFYLEEVCLAIVETTGTVNIYKDPNAQTNIKKCSVPPMAVITDSKIIAQNLKITGFDNDKIVDILDKHNYNLDNILLMTLDGNGRYNITLREG